MERLTTDKPVSEMGMLEMAYNSCYVGEDGSARYRDFETDIDARELARKLMVDFNIWIPDMIEMTNDENFDWVMLEELSNADVSEKMFADGLIPLFYRNLWAMANLRERLKHYEDAEEQGLLLRLPCELGDTVYILAGRFGAFYEEDICDGFYIGRDGILQVKVQNHKGNHGTYGVVGKTVFLTKEEAEAALAKMESEV